MPNAEIDPTEYKNKHPKGITLDTYSGIANDFMALNASVADRFMQVSDMRNDIVIIQKPQDRVRDYEDVGFVKVAKFLKMPRLDIWGQEDAITQVKRENDTWLIAVCDQDLADKVSRLENGKKFDERFVDAFNTEVNRGLITCLKREKFLNGGKYNFGFVSSYYGLINFDSLLGYGLIQAIIDGDAKQAAIALGLTAFCHTVFNSLNYIGTGLNYTQQRISQRQHRLSGTGDFFYTPLTPNYNDPFVRHSLPEFLLPGVPVDRYLRGRLYLSSHGKNLITT